MTNAPDSSDASGPPATPIRAGQELPAPSKVIALRVVGRNVQLDLLSSQESFTLGAARAPSVDLTLDGEGVSRLHATLRRKDNKLRVIDHDSTNGTFFRGRRDPDFEIAAGDVFEVARVLKLIALDDALLLLRRRLHWVLGLRAHGEVDDALEKIARNGPVVLVGPGGLEQRKIADEIHRLSPFCGRDLVVAPATFDSEAEQQAKLAHAVRGSMLLDLARSPKPPVGFLRALFAGDIRPIIAAPTVEHAATFAVGHPVILLPTIAQRRHDIARLLDALIVALHGESKKARGPLLPLSALGKQNVEGLTAHAWEGNFPELHDASVRLHAVLAHGLKLGPAAEFLGVARSTLSEALGRIGVSVRRAGDGSGDDVIDGQAAPTPPMPL